MSANAILTREHAADVTGTFHTFGDHGPAYEVIGIESGEFALVRVVETGETLSYPIASVRNDPDA
jgi:hypothetical protein